MNQEEGGWTDKRSARELEKGAVIIDRLPTGVSNDTLRDIIARILKALADSNKGPKSLKSVDVALLNFRTERVKIENKSGVIKTTFITR